MDGAPAWDSAWRPLSSYAESYESRLSDAAQAGTPAFERAVEAFSPFLPCQCGSENCQFASKEDARMLAVAYLRFTPGAHENDTHDVDLNLVYDIVRLMDLETYLAPLSRDLVTRHVVAAAGGPDAKTGDPAPKTDDPDAKTYDPAPKTYDPDAKTDGPDTKTDGPDTKTDGSKTGGTDAESADEPCPICYVPYGAGDEVCTLQCTEKTGHRYHYSCMLRMIMGSDVDLDGMFACPLCRTRHQMHDWSLQKYLRLRISGAGGQLSN